MGLEGNLYVRPFVQLDFLLASIVFDLSAHFLEYGYLEEMANKTQTHIGKLWSSFYQMGSMGLNKTRSFSSGCLSGAQKTANGLSGTSVTHAASLYHWSRDSNVFRGNISREVIETAFGLPVDVMFDSFEDEPLASGSIGQVHKAKLSPVGATVTGVEEHTQVAIKALPTTLRSAMDT